MVHLALLVGELARAQSAGLIDHEGRLHLGIARLAGLVEEEGLQRALEAGHLADIDGEARTGDLDAEVEIDEVELLQQIPVTKGAFGKIGLHAAWAFCMTSCRALSAALSWATCSFTWLASSRLPDFISPPISRES